MPIFYEKRQLVTPGDLLTEDGFLAGENTFRVDKKIYASRIGLFDYDKQKVFVVALKAFYAPLTGDLVIGKVVEVSLSGWMLDVRAPYPALLRASEVFDRPFKPHKNDLPSVFDVGDFVIASIISYDRTRSPRLSVNESGLGKITKGQVIKVNSTKIPRIIGRKGSMINMIKKETGCQFTVGNNGVILITGKTREAERLAALAIRKIEEESHTSGLTERVNEMIKKEKVGEESVKNS